MLNSDITFFVCAAKNYLNLDIKFLHEQPSKYMFVVMNG